MPLKAGCPRTLLALLLLFSVPAAWMRLSRSRIWIQNVCVFMCVCFISEFLPLCVFVSVYMFIYVILCMHVSIYVRAHSCVYVCMSVCVLRVLYICHTCM